MFIKVIYNHPAFPPENIDVNKEYYCQINDNIYKIIDYNKKIIFTSNKFMIHTLFKPIDKTWKEIDDNTNKFINRKINSNSKDK